MKKWIIWITWNFSCIEKNQLAEILTERIQEEVTCCQAYYMNEQQKQRRKDNLMEVIHSINDQLRTQIWQWIAMKS